MAQTPRRRVSRTSETDAPPEKHSYYIEALARGLAVLDAFGPQRPELTLKDMADAAQVTQPSALRIGYTLVDAGYLFRNPITKGYRLGPRALSIGLATLGSMTLPEIAEPYLIDLRNRSQETIKLAVPSDLDVVVIARYASVLHPTSTSYVGTRMPIAAASLGRAILAWLPSERVDAILSRLGEVKLTPKTVSKTKIRGELDRTRRRGYALNDQGVTLENRAVAAPLIDPTGRAVGSINLSMSAQRISLAELERTMAPLVVETAEAVSTMLPPDVQGAGDSSNSMAVS